MPRSILSPYARIYSFYFWLKIHYYFWARGQGGIQCQLFSFEPGDRGYSVSYYAGYEYYTY